MESAAEIAEATEISALNPLLVAVRSEATASCQRFREFAFSFLFSAQSAEPGEDS